MHRVVLRQVSQSEEHKSQVLADEFWKYVVWHVAWQKLSGLRKKPLEQYVHRVVLGQVSQSEEHKSQVLDEEFWKYVVWQVE